MPGAVKQKAFATEDLFVFFTSGPASLCRVCDFVTHDFHCNFVLCCAVSLRSNAPREQFFRMQPNAWLTSLESNDDGQGHSLTYRPTDQWMEDAYRQNLRRCNSHNSFANLTLRNKTWNLLLQPIPGIVNGTASWDPSERAWALQRSGFSANAVHLMQSEREHCFQRFADE